MLVDSTSLQKSCQPISCLYIIFFFLNEHVNMLESFALLGIRKNMFLRITLIGFFIFHFDFRLMCNQS